MRETIYKENLKTFYVDEKYNFKGTYIDEFYHGVCIDFSLLLKNKYEEKGLKSFLIATKTIEGNHAALLYEVNDEIYVVDPITDARILTKDNMSKSEREEYINNNILNINILLQEYINNNGKITIFDDNLSPVMNSDKVDEIKNFLKPEEPQHKIK